MGILEVILLLLGAGLAVLSFVIPASKDTVSQETKVLAKEEIKAMVDTEMDGIRQHVDDVVDEAVGYAVEKTERSLERLTNEKIMAVNEYSDTVLQEINKNHEEAMFLYDMLNAKHDNLKEVVSEADKVAKEVKEAVADMAEQKVKEAQPAIEQVSHVEAPEKNEPKITVPTFEKLDLSMLSAPSKQEKEPKKETAKKTNTRKQKEAPKQEDSIKEWDFLADVKDPGTNNNELILQLHNQGKSTVAIAKELGLGVGEVKLVIDLHKNA